MTRAAWIALALTTSIGAQGPTVTAECSVESIEFGAPFDFSLIRQWPDGFVASRFDPRALAPLSVLDARHHAKRDDATTIERWELTVACYDVGTLTVPGVPMSVSRADGSDTEVARSAPRTLVVRSILDDPNSPIEPPTAPPAPDSDSDGIWYAALGGLAAVVVLLLGRLRRHPAPADPLRSAYDQLEDPEADPARLARAIRTVLGAHARMRCEAMTTRQIASLPAFTDDHELVSVLEDCDAVAFGHADVDRPELVSRARRVIASFVEEPAP